MKSIKINLIFFILLLLVEVSTSQSLVHPGIHQTREDMDYMKQQVLKGEQPWKNAFDSLLANTRLEI